MPPDAGSSSGVRRTTTGPTVPDPAEPGVPPTLRDLLAHLSKDRERTGYTVEEVPRYAPEPAAPRKSPFIVGCLFRIVLLIVLLIAAAVLGLFVLFGSG
jgi:hypothetical protein